MTGRIGIDGTVGRHAAGWHEVTPSMARSLAPLLLGADAAALRKATEAQRTEEANALYAQLSVMAMHRTLAPCQWRFMYKWSALTDEHFAMMLASDENPVGWVWDVRLTRQLQPTVRVGLRTYIGPKNYFMGMCWGEYLFAQDCYTDWLKTGKRDKLVQMFATVYRPERTDVAKHSPEYADDAREQFVPQWMAGRAQRMARLDDGVLLAFVLYWRGCHAKMRKRYRWLFMGEEGEGSDIGTVLVMSAKSASSADVKEAALSPLHNVLRRMDKQAQMDAKRKK